MGSLLGGTPFPHGRRRRPPSRRPPLSESQPPGPRPEKTSDTALPPAASAHTGATANGASSPVDDSTGVLASAATPAAASSTPVPASTTAGLAAAPASRSQGHKRHSAPDLSSPAASPGTARQSAALNPHAGSLVPSSAASKRICPAHSAHPAACYAGVDTVMTSSFSLRQQAAETSPALLAVSANLPSVAFAIVGAEPSARPDHSASAPGDALMVPSTLQASDNDASAMVAVTTM